MTSFPPESDPPPTLQDIQQWMQQIIVHPEGVTRALAAGTGREIIDVAPETLESVIRRSRHLTADERLQIYNRAYFARLIECLQAEFPALRHALGEKAFDGFAFAYLKRYPSRSYTLGELGKSFPAYLAESRRESLGDETESGWADFLIDVARLERLYADVFDGPGIEEEPPFDWERFRSLAPNEFDQVRVLLNPAFRLIELKYPVQQYITAVRRRALGQSDVSPQIPPPQFTRLAVTRRDYIVHRAPLLERQYVVLDAIMQGHSLAGALERLFESDADFPDDFASVLHEDFREWTRLGYICGLETRT